MPSGGVHSITPIHCRLATPKESPMNRQCGRSGGDVRRSRSLCFLAHCCVPTRPAELPSVTRGDLGFRTPFRSAEESSRKPLPPPYLVGLCGSFEMVTPSVGAE